MPPEINEADAAGYIEALLTPEEREAIAGGDDYEDEDEDDGAIVTDMDQDEGDADVKAQPVEAPETAPLATAEPEVAPRAPAPVATEDLSPLVRALDDAKDAREQAWVGYQDGDLDEDEYRAAITAADTAADDARDKIAMARARPAVQQQLVQQAEDQRWDDTVAKFKAAEPALFAPDRVSGFNAHVQFLTQNRPDLSFEGALKLAKTLYTAEAAAMGKPMDATPGPKPARGPRPGAPKTLALAPQASSATVDDGRYAGVDRLLETGDPLGAEAAMGRMSAEEFDAYARSA
jgi:hypothetical protein